MLESTSDYDKELFGGILHYAFDWILLKVAKCYFDSFTDGFRV